MQERITLEFDGGSRGNPGPAGVGIVLCVEDGTPLVTLGRFIGTATNNVAEYKALLTGLEQAKVLGARKLTVRGDSQLVVRQVMGEYRVKHPDLKPLHEEVLNRLRQFDDWRMDHNLRDKNELADRLANLAMDRKGEVHDADETPARKSDEGQFLECEICGSRIKVIRPGRGPSAGDFVCRCGKPMR